MGMFYGMWQWSKVKCQCTESISTNDIETRECKTLFTSSGFQFLFVLKKKRFCMVFLLWIKISLKEHIQFKQNSISGGDWLGFYGPIFQDFFSLSYNHNTLLLYRGFFKMQFSYLNSINDYNRSSDIDDSSSVYPYSWLNEVLLLWTFVHLAAQWSCEAFFCEALPSIFDTLLPYIMR